MPRRKNTVRGYSFENIAAIEAKRKELDLTIEELAGKAEVSRDTVNKWLDGEPGDKQYGEAILTALELPHITYLKPPGASPAPLSPTAHEQVSVSISDFTVDIQPLIMDA